MPQRRLAPPISRLVLPLVLLTSCPSAAVAQLRFDSWTTENGLPQNSVNDIVQTRDGYLWLATHGGLVRFDGVRFVVFDRSVQGVESQRIRALHEDRRGTLWAATEDGMLIRYQDEQFTTYDSADGLPDATAARIEEDDAGSLWITWVGALTSFDGRRFVTLTPEDFGHGLAAPPLRHYLDAWWRQDSGGLHALVNGRVRTYAAESVLRQAAVTGVNVDGRGNVWIRTRGRGVIKSADGRTERYTTGEGLPTDSPDGLFHEGPGGDVWYSDTSGYHVYRIQRGRRELVTVPGTRGVSGLRAFHVDREGSIWLGTVAGGLHRIRETVVTVYDKRDGAPMENVYSILQDKAGAVWIGNGGLTRYAGGRFVAYSSAPSGISPDTVTSLYEDKAGRLWVGTSGGLRYLADGRLRRFVHSSGFLDGRVRAMHQDRAGTFWFATDHGLVSSIEGRLTRYTTADGLSHSRVTALFEDRAAALWIGTFRGVTRLKDGVFTTYTEKDGFIGNQVRAFHEDADGIVWIGTYDGGLYRLASGRLTRYTRREGLHDNGVFQILEDNYGYFWMGSNIGIYRVSRHELNEFAEGRRRSITSLVFGVRDGLATLEVNGGSHPSGLKGTDGRLWFPTMGGVAVVDPSRVRMDAPPVRTIIEELRVGDEARDVRQELRVPPDAPVIEIRYTAPTFVKPQQARFRYRLLGLADEWVETGARRTATFHRLPPGRYRFVVTAANHLGVWDAEGQSLAIVVMPPFWRTWWFSVTALGVVAAAVSLFHVARVRRLRREQAQRSAYLQELIDSQERERSRIAHEMHDSLGHDLAIVNRRAREGAERTVVDEKIRQDFTEIRLVAERLDQGMRAMARGLRPYHLDKIGLTKSIAALVDEIGDFSEIELRAAIDNVDGLFPKDSEIHIYRIVQEALTNIVKHARALRAQVTISREAGRVVIRIDDDGDGLRMEPGEAAALDADGFGLIGIRERARLLGGNVEIRSRHRGGTSVVVRLRTQYAP